MWKKISKGVASPLPMLDSIQIEVTSRCSLKCVMCPNISLPKWSSRDMDFETFTKISKYFTHAKLIYLQGWGEPLLHARIFDMIKVAKGAGCKAGFTTNGMLLTKEASEKLLRLGLDIIVFSIGGATKGTHESIRVGSNFERFIENIEQLINLKAELKSRIPKINLSFLMTKGNIGELPEVINLANELGIKEVVATNLDYVATPLHDKLKVFSCNSSNKEFEEKIMEAGDKARKYGITFRPYPLKLEEVVMCELNPLNQVFISCEGFVSACNYLNLSTTSEIPRIFCGERYGVPRTYFGDVSKEDFFKIWENPEYQGFRGRYARRVRARERTLGSLDIDADPVEIEEAEGKLYGELKAYPVPEVCKTCYKAYGI